MLQRFPKISLILFFLVLYALWSSVVPEGKPLEQARFERWLAARQSPEARMLEKEGKLAAVQIEISAWTSASDKRTYSFSSEAGKTAPDRISRLLNLMLDGGAFTKRDEASATSPGMSIRIKSAEYSFETSLQQKSFDNNLQLETLLKLAQMFSR